MKARDTGTASDDGTKHAGTSAPTQSSDLVMPPPEIVPGDCIGRYTVRALIGTGGMGRVYAAHDPELGRIVALKLIRTDGRGPSRRARVRLIREAQALARLHHPNVVTIHDVGSEGDQVFIAMELVPGPTLAEWLEVARGWSEVLTAHVAAGRGLAAAHDAGIVHRDFKPANVIVGADRVVVVDFGLARAGTDDPDEGPESAPAHVLGVSLTLTGEHPGTPAYMPPEQRRGEATDARSDQFSFCMTLWEALHGERPVEGKDRPSPRRRGVPGWVNAAVLRGLASDPADRWPSMHELLRALSRDPAGRWRRMAVLIVGLALAAAAVWGLARKGRVDPCVGAASGLVGVWDPAIAAAVQSSFAATRLAYSGDSARRVAALLDDYAARWTDASFAICRATRVEGRQSDTLMDLRMACLERRKNVLGALTRVWAGGVDDKTLDGAIDAARGLPPIDECAAVTMTEGAAPLPSEPDRAALVVATRAHLDAVEALVLAHHGADARREVTAARIEAEASGFAPLRAEAAAEQAKVLGELDDPTTEAAFLEAARLAGGAKDDRLVATTLVDLANRVAGRDAQRALLVSDVAEASLARAGNDDRLQIVLLRTRARAYAKARQYVAARALLVTARAFAVARLGAGDRETVAIMGRLAWVDMDQGDYAAAVQMTEENLAVTTAVLGPDHPRVAFILDTVARASEAAGDHRSAEDAWHRAATIMKRAYPLSDQTAAYLLYGGSAALELGRLDEARAAIEEALAIREQIFGPVHQQVALTLNNLAIVRRKQGRFDESKTLIERSLAIMTKLSGPDAELLAYPLSSLGEVFEVTGDPRAALPPQQRALELTRKADGESHPNTLHRIAVVATDLAALGRCKEAKSLLATALPGLEKALGPEHPRVAHALVATADCEPAARATPLLVRAETILEAKNGDRVDRGAVEWRLARALWATDRRDEARATARRAETDLAADADGAFRRSQVIGWLAGKDRAARP